MFKHAKSEERTMPMVIVTPTGSGVARLSSYNRFKNKDQARRFIEAQRKIATHLGLTRKFEDELSAHELVAEKLYVTSLGKL